VATIAADALGMRNAKVGEVVTRNDYRLTKVDCALKWFSDGAALPPPRANNSGLLVSPPAP
jgi:hypothetical protein